MAPRSKNAAKAALISRLRDFLILSPHVDISYMIMLDEGAKSYARIGLHSLTMLYTTQLAS